MAAGTSPAIVALPGAGYEIAFVNSDGYLRGSARMEWCGGQPTGWEWRRGLARRSRRARAAGSRSPSRR